VTIVEIVTLLRTHKPKTVKDLKAIGFSLKSIGSGAFRSCYVINNDDLRNRVVVKIPLSGWSNCDHAQHEIYMIRKINKTKRYAALQPFMPRILYADYRHGIIVVPYYYALGESKGCVAANVLSKVADAVFEDNNSDERDITSWNIRQTKEGDLKIIDLGLV
jgi:hypothetical protein